MSDNKTWFVITDGDFALLNGDEFAQVWSAMSVVMRKRALEKMRPTAIREPDLSSVTGARREGH